VLLTDYWDITVEATPFRVGLRYPGQSLDFGSMAKGYAADYVKAELKENGINDYLINFGGTIITGEQEREIGIRNPFADAGHPAGYLTMKNSAAVTSGIYENGFRKNGKWYHHLIDPATGYPAAEGLSGVTLIGDSAEKLDILTTMAFVKGIRKSLPVLEAENTDGIFITQNGEIYTTPALSESFRKGNEIHVRNESA